MSTPARRLFPYNLRFPGQIYMAETGLNQNYYRDYDPVVGRYVESDPIGLKGGVNTYAYVGSSPIGSRDPRGLDSGVTMILYARAEVLSGGHTRHGSAGADQCT